MFHTIESGQIMHKLNFEEDRVETLEKLTCWSMLKCADGLLILVTKNIM